MKRLRLAVIGAGHLGRIHTRLALSLDLFEVVGVVDPDEAARKQVASEFGVPVFATPAAIVGDMDAAVIATPTQYHHEVGMELLQRGVHLLIEKPIAPNVMQAQQLVEAAGQQNIVLQVGHVERFSPALAAVSQHLERVKYIEAKRTSGYSFRSTDIGVVLDLMVHDLDIVLSLVESELVDVRATGVSVMGGHEDIAEARLQFDDGCVVNLTASRCSFVNQREMQLFTENGFVSIDFGNHQAKVVHPCEPLLRREIDFESFTPDQRTFARDNLFAEYLKLEEISVEGTNAILDEQRDFAESINHARSPRVSGQQALRTITVAEQILAKIAAHRWAKPRSKSHTARFDYMHIARENAMTRAKKENGVASLDASSFERSDEI